MMAVSLNNSHSGRRKRAKVDKDKVGSKGLRHFSMLVCQKVKEKGVTTYNEVGVVR